MARHRIRKSLYKTLSKEAWEVFKDVQPPLSYIVFGNYLTNPSMKSIKKWIICYSLTEGYIDLSGRHVIGDFRDVISHYNIEDESNAPWSVVLLLKEPTL